MREIGFVDDRAGKQRKEGVGIKDVEGKEKKVSLDGVNTPDVDAVILAVVAGLGWLVPQLMTLSFKGRPELRACGPSGPSRKRRQRNLKSEVTWRWWKVVEISGAV
jgi:hypothetical protein